MLLSLTVVFKTFIYNHDWPLKIAKEWEHPHAEAIHLAFSLSPVTLDAMRRLVFTWALSHKKVQHAISIAAAPES